MKNVSKFRCFVCSCRFSGSKPVADRPSLDFDYLLNPDNLDKIRSNIKSRKQVGDIDALHEIWNQLSGFIGKTNQVSESELKLLWDDLYRIAFQIPNHTHPKTPIGDESQSQIATEFGPKFPDSIKRVGAEEIAHRLGSYFELRDSCGEKAYSLIGPLARLESALIGYSKDIVSSKGFEPITVPDVLNVNIPQSCGLMQRSESGILYLLGENEKLCLAGTSEMGIASYLKNKIFEFDQLPLKLMAVSRCFRPETAAGKLSRGLYRVHEFNKLEMFVICKENESDSMLEELLNIQTDIFKSLGLHCRVLNMASEELGAAAYQKYDVEAWMPARESYGEISSASNCRDFQSRRLNIRYKDTNGKLQFVHTCNGTACATTRLLITLLEQCQPKKGLLKLPSILESYLIQKRKPGLKMRINNMKNDFK